MTVTTDTRGKWSFETSSRNSPSGGCSASETVVVDGVNVFLDLEAVVLGNEIDQPSRLPFRVVARSAFPCRAMGGVPVYTLNDPCNPLCVGCSSRSENCCSP